ncbi:MAG: dethiobiotin synthase [Nostocoides sp.]
MSLPSVVLVTGTGPGVGLTATTAALASVLRHRTDVAVIKLVQTGTADWEGGDVDRIRLWVKGVDVHERVRLRLPLAPVVAAARVGFALPRVAEHAKAVGALGERSGLVLVEGTGGTMTHLDTRRGTLLDVAAALRYKGSSVGFILAARPTRGDLNAAALTGEVLRQRGLPFLGVVLTHWPGIPDLEAATRDLLDEFPDAAGVPLLGRLPDLPGPFEADDFGQARIWLDLE